MRQPPERDEAAAKPTSDSATHQRSVCPIVPKCPDPFFKKGVRALFRKRRQTPLVAAKTQRAPDSEESSARCQNINFD